MCAAINCVAVQLASQKAWEHCCIVHACSMYVCMSVASFGVRVERKVASLMHIRRLVGSEVKGVARRLRDHPHTY